MKGSFIKMKKLIALLLAVSSLAMSTSALAYDNFSLSVDEYNYFGGKSRNYAGSSTDGSGNLNYGSPVYREAGLGSAYLPTFRPGDVITFRIDGKTGDASDVIPADVDVTFICSKKDTTSYDNYTVQLIDQIKTSSETIKNDNYKYHYLTYKLRNSLADGEYKIEIRVAGVANVKTFRFLIGKPSVELLYVNEIADGATVTKADKYLLKGGDAHCFGKAVVTGGANFSQVDTDFGFVFNGTYNDAFIKKTERDGIELTADAQNALQASVDHNGTHEIGGEAQYFFRMVFEDVYTYTGTEPTDDQKPAIFSSLPDVDVYLNE